GNRLGRLAGERDLVLLDCGNRPRLQVGNAGDEPLVLLDLLLILGNGDRNGLAGRVDRLSAVADLLAQNGERVAVDGAFRGLVGTAADEGEKLFEHCCSSSYERRSRLQDSGV